MFKSNIRILALVMALSMVVSLGASAGAVTSADTLYISSAGSDANDGTTPDTPLATLKSAYGSIEDGGQIIILDDLDVAEKVIFDQDKTVTIDGGGNAITYTSAATIGPDRYGFFTVQAGDLTLTNITVQLPAQKGANGRVLYVAGGSVTLQDGTTLANGYLGYGGGGVLVADGGTLTMEDGAIIQDCTIVNNTTAYGGGIRVANGGTFNMTGGTIADNTIHTSQGYDSYGGGVAIEGGGSMSMTGGAITGNSVDTVGGGIYVAEGGTLSLAGDLTVTGNTVAGAANNLYLPTTGATFHVAAAVTGSIGLTHGEADYNVIAGTPSDGYTIQAIDEAAYTYDTGAYDIRLKGGNLVLYPFTVGLDLSGDHFDSSYTDSEAIKGQDFTTTLTPNDGYQLPGDITVTIGGTPSTDYTYDQEAGTVYIPGEAVTDDIIITISPDELHTITVDVEHTQADKTEVIVIQSSSTTITFSSAPRYGLPTAVTVTGPCDHTYNPATGQLVLSNVSGPVSVSATGSEVYHDLHFAPAGGLIDPAIVTITESQPTLGTLPTPTRPGYTFTGWFTASGDRVNSTTANHLTADLYLTARWSADTNIKYWVQYWVELVDSGSNPGYISGATQTQRMEYGGVARTYYLYNATLYNDGISDGHKDISVYALGSIDGLDLSGLTANGANVYSVTMAPDGSSVFPLFYDRNDYTLTFDPNGGAIRAEDMRATVQHGSVYGTLPTATRTGYTISGWYTAPHAGRLVSSSDVYSLAQDQTLYAHWTTTGDTPYTVTHMVQDLRDNLVGYDKPAGYSVHVTDSLLGDADTTVDIYALTIQGYTLSPENAYTVHIRADGTANATLYYDRVVTTISYDANGGTLAAPSFRTLLYYGGTVVSLAPAPTRSGYTFDGWFMAPAETAREVTPGLTFDELNPDAVPGLTLYAHWTKINNSDGGGSSGGGGGGSSKPVETPTAPAPVTGEHIAYINGYVDGTVRPTNNIMRCEAAAIFYRLLPPASREQYGGATGSAFPDVPTDAWYADAVATLAKAGIIEGCDDGTFRPFASITRAEFATMAARFSSGGSGSSERTSFNDVSGHWAEPFITHAAALGWVHGDGSGAYRPDSAISRAETVTLVNNVLGRHVAANGMLPGMTTFSDNSDTQAWYYLDIQEAANGHTYEVPASGGAEKWTGLIGG